MDISSLNDGCEACGITGVQALIEASLKLDYKTQFLDYTTSAQMTKDTSSVVGYTSFVVGE